MVLPAEVKSSLEFWALNSLMNCSILAEGKKKGLSLVPLLSGRLSLTLPVRMATASRTFSSLTQAMRPILLMFSSRLTAVLNMLELMTSARKSG